MRNTLRGMFNQEFRVPVTKALQVHFNSFMKSGDYSVFSQNIQCLWPY